MTVGERIARLREMRGMTQTELGAFCGEKKQNIWKYEKGAITNIPLEKIELIARALDVSPCYLMGWDETCEAKKIVEDYLALDYWGQKAVRSVIDNEKARCSGKEIEASEQNTGKIVTDQIFSEKGPDTSASSAKESGAG